jgi:nicotinate phosphoribosyltransferase
MALVPCTEELPSSSSVTPLLTDLYQLTMCYVYWKDGRHNHASTFDLFFRTAPFKGEYTIFAGLDEVLRFVQTFKFSASDIAYLRTILPTAAEGFWAWLSALDCSAVKLYAIAEGTLVFPREPLIRVEGPLGICQLLETTLLNLCNFASLVTTNACRMRQAAGDKATMLEFGLRRAQGPDGAMSASRYSYMGGCDGTSNVLAGKVYGVPPRGTHAHSMVCSYTSLSDLSSPMLGDKNLVELSLKYRKEMGTVIASEGELAAFIAFSQCFPDNFLALVDTYDTLNSGVPNFLAVALALLECGHTPRGIRLDSGDLAYLSKEARKQFRECDAKYGTKIAQCNIVASNDLNEAVLLSLQEQGHEINTFAIGTNLVTCQAQPALGMVYKLVEINGEPRIKLSQDSVKVRCFFLLGSRLGVGGGGGGLERVASPAPLFFSTHIEPPSYPSSPPTRLPPPPTHPARSPSRAPRRHTGCWAWRARPSWTF